MFSFGAQHYGDQTMGHSEIPDTLKITPKRLMYRTRVNLYPPVPPTFYVTVYVLKRTLNTHYIRIDIEIYDMFMFDASIY